MTLGRKAPSAPHGNDLLEELNAGWSVPPVVESSAAQRQPPAQPAAQPNERQEPIPRRRRATPRHAQEDWLNRLIAESGLFAIALAIWGVNGYFTILGFMAIGGAWWVGVLGHLLISRAEVYLWHRWRDPIYLACIVFCIAVDIGTTLVGALPLAQKYAPWLLGPTPLDVWAWRALAASPAPTWWLNALVLVALAALIALSAERLVRKFWGDVRETWDLRPAA